MPKTRPPYSPEFRQQMVELVRAGRNPAELSREFPCSAQTIRNWVGQAAADAGKPRAGSNVLDLSPENYATDRRTSSGLTG